MAAQTAPPGKHAAAAVLAIAAFILLVIPTAANAVPARFVYELCDSALPGGGNPSASFTVNPGVPFTPFDSCGQPGGSIGITETGSTSATFAYWSVAVPATPGGYVESETISAIAYGLGPANDHTFVYEQGWPPNNFGENTRVFSVNSSYNIFVTGGGFSILMNCDGNVGPCGAGPTVAAHYIAVTENDQRPPTLTNLRGSLFDEGIIRGQQSVAIDAKDVGGGLTNVSLFVNGVLTGTPKTLTCSTVFVNNPSIKGTVATSPTPCPTATSADWIVNTEAAPFHAGTNTVQLCASDFATVGSPSTTCSSIREIEVDNSCVNSPVAGGAQLSAQFADSNSDTTTVGYGSNATIVGRLLTNAGDPVANATLCVKTQVFEVDPGLVNTTSITTDATGHYAYTVPAGPNREIMVGYRHDTSQVARDVRYYSHVQPTLTVTPEHTANGKAVHFTGQLPNPNSAGHVVVLQANPPKSTRWITFRRATANGHGIFGSDYRFSSTSRKTTYRFRALVPTQAGYPWLEGTSGPVKVHVSPCPKNLRKVMRHEKLLCLKKRLR